MKFFAICFSTAAGIQRLVADAVPAPECDSASRRDWRLPMPSHKFHVGDTVMLKPSISRNVPGGVYEVIKQLPHNGREYEYRIKSANEEHERVAGEGELTKA